MEKATTAEDRLMEATFEMLFGTGAPDLRSRFNNLIADFLVREITVCYPVWFATLTPQVYAFQKLLTDVGRLDYGRAEFSKDTPKICLHMLHFFKAVPPAAFSRSLRIILLDYLELTATDVQKHAQRDVITDFILIFRWLDVAEEVIAQIPLPEGAAPHSTFDAVNAISLRPSAGKSKWRAT
jgi:hypothetical protein